MNLTPSIYNILGLSIFVCFCEINYMIATDWVSNKYNFLRGPVRGAAKRSSFLVARPLTGGERPATKKGLFLKKKKSNDH